MLNFIVKCRNSDSQLVRFIATCGLEYSSSDMHFSVTRNAIFCSLRYGISIDELCDDKLFRKFYLSQISNESEAFADNATEIAHVRDDIFFAKNFVPRVNKIGN
jgi:hypothetical protein